MVQFEIFGSICKIEPAQRVWGYVAVHLHTPLSPLFRRESKSLKFLNIKLVFGKLTAR